MLVVTVVGLDICFVSSVFFSKFRREQGFESVDDQ